MKKRMNLFVSMVFDFGIVIGSITLFGLMLHYSAFTWYVAGPIMFTAGERASELVKVIRKINEE